MTEVPQARIFFPQPALPNVVSLNAASLIHAVIENITYSIRGNCDQLAEFAQPKAVKAIGGMTRSAVWPKMLANVLNKPVLTTLQSEGSLLGAAICAASGAGWYPDLRSAAHAMVQWKPVVEPDKRAEAYKSCYSRWTEVWCSDRGEQ
jgi:xylulokinase